MHVKSALTRPTVRRRKAKTLCAFPPVSYERAKTVVERERNEGTRKRYEYFRQSLKRERKRSEEDARKETRKYYEHFHRSLKRERKRSEEYARKGSRKNSEHFRRSPREGEKGRRGRDKRATERRGGKRVSLVTCSTVREHSRRLAWKHESKENS